MQPGEWTSDTLRARFAEVRAHTERLAAPLSPEDQTVQSMPDVSPTKWHRAHVTWFFETFVLAHHEPGFCSARSNQCSKCSLRSGSPTQKLRFGGFTGGLTMPRIWPEVDSTKRTWAATLTYFRMR